MSRYLTPADINWPWSSPLKSVREGRDMALQAVLDLFWPSTSAPNYQCELMQSDYIYRALTYDNDRKSRGQKWFFSSCAYLPLFIYECCLGLDVPGLGLTGVADNPVARLGKYAKPIDYPGDFEKGDTFCMWDSPSTSDAHIVMVLANHSETEELLIAQLGAGAPKAGSIVLGKYSGKRFNGGRQWRWRLSLADVYGAAVRGPTHFRPKGWAPPES